MLMGEARQFRIIPWSASSIVFEEVPSYAHLVVVVFIWACNTRQFCSRISTEAQENLGGIILPCADVSRGDEFQCNCARERGWGSVKVHHVNTLEDGENKGIVLWCVAAQS